MALDGTWQYRKFVEGDGWQDRKFQPNVNVALRGGWGIGVGWFLETFGYDEGLYADYFLGVPDGMGGITYQPFTGQPTINNNDVYITANTPVFKRVDANVFVLYGYDENFPEWASGRIFFFNWDLNFRPSDQVRLGISYDFHQVNRPSDGSQVQLGRVTRAKLEYQIVNAAEARGGTGRLSFESPVGQAVVGHKQGDVVEVTAPNGVIRFKIESVSS